MVFLTMDDPWRRKLGWASKALDCGWGGEQFHLYLTHALEAIMKCMILVLCAWKKSSFYKICASILPQISNVVPHIATVDVLAIALAFDLVGDPLAPKSNRGRGVSGKGLP